MHPVNRISSGLMNFNMDDRVEDQSWKIRGSIGMLHDDRTCCGRAVRLSYGGEKTNRVIYRCLVRLPAKVGRDSLQDSQSA